MEQLSPDCFGAEWFITVCVSRFRKEKGSLILGFSQNVNERFGTDQLMFQRFVGLIKLWFIIENEFLINRQFTNWK